MEKYLGIDEEGFFSLDRVRVEDEKMGRELLKNLKRHEKDRFITNWDGSEALIEAFDEPVIVKHVERNGSEWKATAPYGYTFTFLVDRLCVDEKDRFHGLT